MNIKEAKEQIKNAITAYFTKNEFGDYVIPIEKQRPIFLMGAPGIGKTAIMEQAASELNVGLVSYSMTHHTRQSALGLPFIVKKNYGGVEYDVSEYTMSEIIASVYDMIETTGHKEGILFLDEINCVSETLAPAMLQFLQYKIFGRHTVPKGWVVVTAGNPPEYNNSVREFDIVTWDRLKRIDVEANYEVWKEYAVNSGVHAAITTYLDIKKANFYKVETTVDGKSFVTARGWSDLSDMIKLYEKNNIKVDDKLVSQYLQEKKIAKEFAIYYDLYNKYKSDYQIGDILCGKNVDNIIVRAKSSKFDERIALIGLLLDAVYDFTSEIYREEASLKLLTTGLRNLKLLLLHNSTEKAFDTIIKNASDVLEKGKHASSMSKDDIYAYNSLLVMLEEIKSAAMTVSPKNADDVFKFVKKSFDAKVKALKESSAASGDKLSNAFKFLENAFGDGQEMLIFVTELTINQYTASFISRYGCPEYFKHNKELLLFERHKDIIREIEILDIDD
jgi:hypothetical protein